MSLKKYLTEAELAAVQPITGDEFDISIRELTNIETVVVEHTEGSITITLDETAIKLLEHCGCTFEDEDEQIDELAPLIGAIGGALGRGVAAGAGALARGAAKAVVGTGIKAAHDKIDKKLFGPKPGEGDYEESVREEDEDKVEYQPQPGDIVQIDYPSAHEGQYGEVIELSPSGDFVYVEFKNGNIESYHSSDLRQATEDEIDQYHNSNDEYEESLNSIRRLSGLPQKEGIENWDMRVTSIPRTEPFKLKKIVVTSKFGKTYTFDTEEEARKHFGKNWDKITDPVWRKENGWKLDMNNTKSEKGLDEGDVIQFKKPALSGDTQNLQAAKKIAKDLYWHASSSYFTDEENAQEEQLHQQLAKMGYSADEDLENQTITITQKSTGKQYRMGEDELLSEAEYRGRKVPLGKPMQGDVAKFKVYVKNPKTGNVKKVNFGDKNMRIKKSNPARRKSFRARHNCANPGPRTSARYWSCRKW